MVNLNHRTKSPHHPELKNPIFERHTLALLVALVVHPARFLNKSTRPRIKALWLMVSKSSQPLWRYHSGNHSGNPLLTILSLWIIGEMHWRYTAGANALLVSICLVQNITSLVQAWRGWKKRRWLIFVFDVELSREMGHYNIYTSLAQSISLNDSKFVRTKTILLVCKD